MKKLLLLVALAGLVGTITPASAEAEAILIAEDNVGDWTDSGGVLATDGAAVGSALGQDLVSASIIPDYDNGLMTFVIKVTELPPIGGTPEATRYVWDMHLGENDILVELDGKFSNYTRGTCDPTAGTCPPPRDPGAQPFVLRGNCTQTTTAVLNLTLCQELAKVQAVFDQPNGTISIPVPISAFALANAGDCPEITSGVNIFGGFLSASPSAFFTRSDMPMDIIEDFAQTAVPTCEAP